MSTEFTPFTGQAYVLGRDGQLNQSRFVQPPLMRMESSDSITPGPPSQQDIYDFPRPALEDGDTLGFVNEMTDTIVFDCGPLYKPNELESITLFAQKWFEKPKCRHRAWSD